MPSKPPKQRLIVGNWKMNGTPEEWLPLANAIAKAAPFKGVQAVICPPYPALWGVSEIVQKSALASGAQNLYPAEKGAFTGEVSAKMLKALGCDYVILGHSERRQILGEEDAFIAQKVSMACSHDLCPILCVGEPDGTENVVFFLEAQLRQSLEGVNINAASELIVAYEPVWAIGTGRAATTADIGPAMAVLRQTLVNLFGPEVGGSVQLLYGGSMTAENAAEILAVKDVSGGLIGGASLKAESFLSLIEASTC